MKVDPIRIKSYLSEIRRNSIALRQLLDKNELVPDSIPLKAAKYILIELAEAMSNTIQHILAKKNHNWVGAAFFCLSLGFNSSEDAVFFSIFFSAIQI